MFFYQTMNYYRRHQKNNRLFIYYVFLGAIFALFLWLFMKIKFSLSWMVYWQEWSYFIVFETLLYSYVTMILRENELKLRLLEFANHDALTKAQNFAAYTSEIKHLFDTYRDNNLNLSMMMFDIDHFKEVNDTYGHLAGDKILKHTVDVVQTIINENDPKIKLYRTGGEEFNVLFPDYDLNAAKVIVNQIFSAINHLGIDINGKKIYISISVGLSAISNDDVLPNDFYNRVDNRLYHSKRNGRMQITAE
ncbi:GGDEF domain-containing protein [Companilactobacillus nuruki]|uniref:GGDEF domain-containing protein n=1 Tax=Companilactobacillus nuruki TaxID=1993540 RepID=UPI002697A8EB